MSDSLVFESNKKQIVSEKFLDLYPDNSEDSKNSLESENTDSYSPKKKKKCQSKFILFSQGSKNKESTSDSSSESESDNEEIKAIFEQNFKKYYVDSSKNSNGNFDNYLNSGLQLINKLPKKSKKYVTKVKEISKKINSQLKPIPKTKKTLILDLDETLVHSDLDKIYKNPDHALNFKDDLNENCEIALFLRPGLFEFLNYAVEHFELIVYTAGYKEYADIVLDYIEKDKKYFTLRLYRDDCALIEPGLYIKDLSIFKGKRDLKNLFIIDNSIFSFAYNLNNGILITSFYNDKEDSMLFNLIDFIQQLIEPCDNVCEVLKKVFKFEEYKQELR